MPPRTPIRLLQIASTSDIGGAEQIMLNLIRYSDPERVVPYLLALTGKGPLARLADQAGTQGQNWALRSIADPRLVRRMRHFLMRQKYDLIQCYGLRAELLTRWAAQALGIKLISSIVSINPHRRWYHHALDRLTMDGVTAWMSTSEAAKKVYIEKVGAPEDRIFVVPTGIPDLAVPDEAARRKARSKLKIAEDAGPVLAVLANIRPAKGHVDLIQAVALIKEKWPGIVCLCAGRDDSGGKIPALAAARGVEKHFRWLGFIPDAAAAVYPAADLAVLPSHWEGMPHALIEALRAGLAAVATDVGGNSEVVRHEGEGLLCSAQSPTELAGAIARALADESARRAWGESARRRYEESFRVEQMVQKMTEVYEMILGRSVRTASKLD